MEDRKGNSAAIPVFRDHCPSLYGLIQNLHFDEPHTKAQNILETNGLQRYDAHTTSRSPSTLAFPSFDGVYLPKQENEFVQTVLEELEEFKSNDNQESVLLFPPLPSRLRFLIHKVTENYPDLASFSVGDGWCRRVVVCFSHLRAELEECSDCENNYSVYEEPSRRRGWMEAKSRPTPKRGRGARRPDQAIYIPRAARDKQKQGPDRLQGSPTPVADLPSLDSSESSHSFTDASSCSCSCSATTEGPSSAVSTNGDSGLLGTGGSSVSQQEEQQDVLMNLSKVGPCPWPPAWDHTVSYFMAMTLENQAEEERPEEKDLEPSGMSAVPQGIPEDGTADFSDEIIAHLKEVSHVSIEHAHKDYSCFENVCLIQDEFTHVIEIYDFPAMFKTEDLLDAFTDYSEGGMKIKWVDNTHALAVFSSDSAALHALSIRHPLIKTRTLSDGSRKAKGKAVRQAEFLQPVKDRPQTDSAVAKRMVSRALGLQKGATQTQRY
ncbi:R3H and coiled-coil domain-containing protein 1 [Aplochiton taeniatus]